MRFWEAFRYISTSFGFLTAIDLVAIPRISSRIPGLSLSYNDRLKKFLKAEISDVIIKYKNEPLLTANSRSSNSVYSLWWQDDTQRPEVVDICEASLVRNLNGHNLIRLNKNNYREFVKLPHFINDRIKNNEISLSHLSDIIRLYLLVHYGGMWIDSCLFVVKPLNISKDLTMPRFQSNSSACKGKWWFGTMYAPSGHKLMRFMLDSLLLYWQRHKAVIDYLMFDSFMMIAYEEFEDVRAEIDRFEISSPDLHRTRYLFDKIVDYSDFNSIIEHNRFISLTWRIHYPNNINGVETYYAALKRWGNEYSKKTIK